MDYANFINLQSLQFYHTFPAISAVHITTPQNSTCSTAVSYPLSLLVSYTFETYTSCSEHCCIRDNEYGKNTKTIMVYHIQWFDLH